MPAETDVLSELDLGEPPKELVAWAKENLNENGETRCQALEEFRNMIFGRRSLHKRFVFGHLKFHFSRVFEQVRPEEVINNLECYLRKRSRL